jgi:CRISPR-associated protein Cmr3
MSDQAQTWIIEPRDPLIARDGRAFDATPGARGTSLPFPFPSTIAGAVRTRAGSSKGKLGYFDGDDGSLVVAVKQIEVGGPLLVEIESDGAALPLAPAPADALLMKDAGDENKAVCKRLVPLQREADGWCDADADDGNEKEPLVGLWQPDKEDAKPYDRAPRFWKWSKFAEWLLKPDAEQSITVATWGHGGAAAETRSHVSIDAATLTHREGALFQTRGLRFSHRDTKNNRYGSATRLGLALRVAKLGELSLPEGFAPLGGERRMAAWQQDTSGHVWPEPPAGVLDAIAEDGACRLMLLTPAYFENGWRPGWLDQSDDGITPRLVAAALGRFQTVSGWDFQAKEPKPSRRLAPAGAVYFLELDGDKEQRRAWAEKRWLQAVSDDEQARRDGFGLAALGAWSGELEERLPPGENA